MHGLFAQDRYFLSNSAYCDLTKGSLSHNAHDLEKKLHCDKHIKIDNGIEL